MVVEDDDSSRRVIPNAILVPLTEATALVIPNLSVAIAPPENGCAKPCGAVSIWSSWRHHVRVTVEVIGDS